MKTSRFSDTQIMAILKQAEEGIPVAQLCREHGMSDASFYKWRARLGGMDASMVSQMRSMEDENRRLKKMYAELSMQNDLLKEDLGKKALRPSQRKEMALQAVQKHNVKVALACRTFSISETCYRYGRKLDSENEEIADWLLRVTAARKSWGFGLCFLYLRNIKGLSWNHKGFTASIANRSSTFGSGPGNALCGSDPNRWPCRNNPTGPGLWTSWPTSWPTDARSGL